jgi:hypothetical protein
MDPNPNRRPKSLPVPSSKDEAIAIANELLKNNYFHRSEKVPDKKGNPNPS